MNVVTLKKNRHKRIEKGHTWIFSNEIFPPKEPINAGDIVEIRKSDNTFAGVGFYNPHSLIAVRILSRIHQTVDETFFLERIKKAIALRSLVYPDTDAIRLIHSESDDIPGLIVDKFKDSLSIQIHSAGTELFSETIINILDQLLNPSYIILRNESRLRTLEGLPTFKSIAKGTEPVPSFLINEHDISYEMNPFEGQKTGFYIDQRENRLNFRKFINKGATVFDAFCNEGGFALNAAKAGASHVTAIDVSDSVLEKGKQNALRNGFQDIIEFHPKDIMKTLDTDAVNGKFDVVNLDPPNFAKNKKSVGAAKRAYRNLHEYGLKLLNPGGILCTSCCSHHIFPDTFYQTVEEAAYRNGFRIKLLHKGSHAPDHPILVGMPETEYLKFLVFQLIN